MEKLNEVNGRAERDGDNELTLAGLLAILWRSRTVILAGAGLAALIGVPAAMSTAKYRSDGFLQFGGAIPAPKDSNPRDKEPSPGIVLADYKRYAAAFSTSGRFDEYVRYTKLEGTAGVEQLRKVFASRSGITKVLEPVYPFTKLDAKELMEQPKDSSNNIIGLRISYEAESPEHAQRMVGLLGRYAMDSIVYLIYSDSLRFKHAEITARITRLDNDIIDSKEKLEEYRRKGAKLKEIVARYPESALQASRQVVSVSEDSARYLSPATHLMSSEVESSNATEAILKAKREQQQSLLLREYYDQAKLALDSNKSGEAILRSLEPLKERIFKSKNLNDEVVKEVYNRISIDNQNATNLYLEKSRFIAGPSMPEHRSTQLSTVALLSFLAGLLIASLAVLARAWSKHKK